MEINMMAKKKIKTLKSIIMNREIMVGVPLVTLYGMLLVMSDPAWVAWAGPMVMGALISPDPPPAMFLPPPDEVIGAASLMLLPAVIAMVLLILLWREKGSVRHERLLTRVVAFLTSH